MEEMLLVESWGIPTNKDTGESVLVESVDEGTGKLYITGVFLQADVVNGNKRLYPKHVLETAINNYMPLVRTRQALGELNHPPRANVDPLQACIIIEDMWWEGSNVMGKARVIEGDHAQGDKLAALIRAGWIPGVSSRGLGVVKPSNKGYNIVQEGFKLTVGVDVVWGQSAPDARVKPIVESIDPVAPTESNDDSNFNLLIARLESL